MVEAISATINSNSNRTTAVAMDPLADLTRYILTSNKERISEAVELFHTKEADQIRILLNLDILSLVDTQCGLAHWLLAAPTRLAALELAVRRLILEHYIAQSLPFNIMLRCTHVLPSAALLTGRVLALYSESNESLVNYTRCKRTTCQQLQVMREYCSYCGHECAADDSTRVLVRTREVLVVPDGAQFRHVFVRLQEELIDRVTLGDHVRFYGYQYTDRSYHACYAWPISAPAQLSMCRAECNAASEEEHLQQLLAVHNKCDTVRSPCSSQDTRLHNLKLALMLQARSVNTTQPLHLAVLTNDTQLIQRVIHHLCTHVNVFHNSQRERLVPAFKLLSPETKSWCLEAGLVNLSRDKVLLIHSAEELSKKELFGIKQVVSRGAMTLGKDDVQLTVKCPVALLALFEEYCNKMERIKEAVDPFDLVFDMRDLSVSVEQLLDTTASECGTETPRSQAVCNAEAQLLLKSYFLTNRRVRGASIERLDFPLHVMETLQKLTLLSAQLRGSAVGTVSDALLAIELVEETLVVKYGTSLLGFKHNRRNILTYHHQLSSAYKEFSRHLQVFCEAHLGLVNFEE